MYFFSVYITRSEFKRFSFSPHMVSKNIFTKYSTIGQLPLADDVSLESFFRIEWKMEFECRWGAKCKT
jgi:hypothetical protein